MRLIFFIKLITAFLAVVILNSARAQTVQVALGPDEIGENQVWTITVTVQNERLKS
jgi:hypothetical protein